MTTFDAVCEEIRSRQGARERIAIEVDRMTAVLARQAPGPDDPHVAT
jgi:hypothetical protein